MGVVVGWDIGGVHLKAARAEDGRIVAAMQRAAPLRAGLAPLQQAFAAMTAAMGPADRHVVTMTGELADTFTSRHEGVGRLAALAASALGDVPASVYAGPSGFVPLADACRHVEMIASANWHASAALVARKCAAALFVDLGSTTADVIPVVAGRIAARGYTDAERLAAGELVYTGLVRGFVMATAQRAPFRGHWTRLVCENFATMADVYRVLGRLPDGVDQMATADGREKTPAASRARLARMVGCDADGADPAEWAALASWFAEAQLRMIHDAAMLVASACTLPPDAPVVGAGIGVAVVRDLAHRITRPYVAFDALLDVAPAAREAASHCAPAAALALIATPT